MTVLRVVIENADEYVPTAFQLGQRAVLQSATAFELGQIKAIELLDGNRLAVSIELVPAVSVSGAKV